jgi:HTH-type transcriptional regulator / antitoxin HigA
MELKIIKTEKDYHKAMAMFEKKFHAKKGTKDSDAADILAMLIAQYENEHFQINAPDPIEAIKYRMEQQNLKQKDLAKYLGGKDKVSKILNRKRKLTLEMIRNLNEFLHIPLNALVKDY